MDQQTEAGILLPEVRELLDENKLSPVAQSAATDDLLFGQLWVRATQDDLESKDARELMKDVIRANTLGNLSRVDMERIIGKFSAEFQSDANKRERFWMRKAYNGVSGFFKRGDWGEREPKATAEVMRALIDKVNDEKIPFSEIDKVKNDLIKESVKGKRPSVSNLPDVPNSVANAKAGVRKVFEAPTELKAVAAVADDRQFTQEDLEFTAAEEGITVAEVLKRLGATGDATKPAKGTE